MNKSLVKIIIAALVNEVCMRNYELYALDLSEDGTDYVDELETVRLMNAISRVVNKEDGQLIDILSNRTSREYVIGHKMGTDKLNIFF